jgi:pantothenate kinase type III
VYAKVIGTGGYATMIAGETHIMMVDPDLTLKGLRIVFDMNRT